MKLDLFLRGVQLWAKRTLGRPGQPPPPPNNDDLVGVTAPHGPRPLRGGAHARPDPAKQRQ
jgi:hypothetical protein